MPISATGSIPGLRASTLKRRLEMGFTLVELLAVLAILALASAAVVLALPGKQSSARHEAERVAARALAARDLAIVGGRPVRLTLANASVQVAVRRDGDWVAPGRKGFANAQLAEGVSASDGAITFDPTGLPDQPQILTLAAEGETAQVTIDAGGSVRVGL